MTNSKTLLLHGGGGPASIARFAETLGATGTTVIAPAHPGFGGTPRPPELDSVEKLVQHYVDLVEREDLTRLLVVGFSLGGWLAAELALRVPKRLRGLVIVDAAGIEVPGEAIADVFSLAPHELSALSYHDPVKFAFDPSKLPPPAQAVIAGNFASLAVYARARGMKDPTLRARLAGITTPTMVVWGQSDRVVTPTYGRAWAQAIPNARFELIPECGHMAQLEKPAELLALVRQFDA
jgi:pimeloyl-ACP methyl ester carboxylesterase